MASLPRKNYSKVLPLTVNCTYLLEFLEFKNPIRWGLAYSCQIVSKYDIKAVAIMNVLRILSKHTKIFLEGFFAVAITIQIPLIFSSAWPMFMHDAQHTSQSPFATRQQPHLEWSVPLSLSPTSASVIGARGIIYIGSLDNNLYAIDPRGAILWSFVTNGPIISSSAVDSEGNIYVGSSDHFLYAVQSNGTLLWNYDLGTSTNSSPTIILGNQSPDTIYTASQNGTLYAFSADGFLLWSTDPLQYGIDFSSPAITSQQLIAIGSLGNPVAWSSGKLHLHNPDGTFHCSYDTGFYQGNGIRSSVSITESDNILFGTKDNLGWGPGVFYVVDQDCNLICHTSDLNHHQSSPAIANNQTIYLGTNQGLLALNETCQILWTAPTESISISSPAIDRNGTILVGSDSGYLFALYPNGTIKWQYYLGEPLGSPIIGPRGQIYVASANNLYAFRGPLIPEAVMY
ncbi:MAG: hypothetical protein COT24_04785 [Candidatus Kerfeldbacteria bacterium CG08_land_8_20_14_0_20_40_16]|uniref:Pyrrolo-quinoline quinone repeat domain-containing protein n=1 Tax=Candidatus Kerfeldbacteria bacterium CG08_land_8_20_14_0_20_40_16 TaxID=2014244 RepID=A0A2H0YUN0_9BACT|nr:MAG: hypothetical protein COT24_04785 [Candidatus Kerfeldbacteria bacterium CG08_land_8_20_14_0_20_40_16]